MTFLGYVSASGCGVVFRKAAGGHMCLVCNYVTRFVLSAVMLDVRRRD